MYDSGFLSLRPSQFSFLLVSVHTLLQCYSRVAVNGWVYIITFLLRMLVYLG